MCDFRHLHHLVLRSQGVSAYKVEKAKSKDLAWRRTENYKDDLRYGETFQGYTEIGDLSTC